MNYKKPILSELYCEFFLESSSLPTEGIFDVVPVLRGNGFSIVEIVTVPLPIQASIDVVPGQLPVRLSPGQLPFGHRVRCWSEDKTSLVQVSTDYVAMNKVGLYLGWPNIRAFMDHVWSLVRQSGINPRTRSISLTTIDQIQAPEEGFSVGKYLNCTEGKIIPRWLHESKGAVDLIIGKGALEIEKLNRQIKLSVRPSSPSVNLRLESTFHNFLGDQSESDLLQQLHIEASESFEAMITEYTRQTVMEGVI